ncbi:hypothetical protein RvY_07443 [Ramazzottius varieornatus]|uniref:Uncharacterized protein n=1 Tax=Ramazzottius varieornatus TaxID=947166 RepID=A0A1D1V4S1_RAMVA|nr:hypothetical protein RvY_07443 [Ramazzottius varieornatus]
MMTKEGSVPECAIAASDDHKGALIICFFGLLMANAQQIPLTAVLGRLDSTEMVDDGEFDWILVLLQKMSKKQKEMRSFTRDSWIERIHTADFRPRGISIL